MSAKPSQSILVVEDSPTQAMKLRFVLEREGWQVDCAGSAESALTKLSESRPNLIVLDVHLPGMKGDEFCRQLRMNLDTRGIPVLMLTADNAGDAERHGLDSGADGYMAKSDDQTLLLLRIKSLLGKSQTQQAVLGGSRALVKTARLLVIDDSATYRMFLQESLAEEGFEVAVAAGGGAGIEAIRDGYFDCVLVDLVMPDIDGIAVCEQITELRRRMDNPLVVLMLTAHESKEDMTRGLSAGADDFVGKSSDMAVLKARIRALLRRKFFQEENQRILQELKDRELEALRERTAKEVAEARAALAEQLQRVNQELETKNRQLRQTQAHLVQSEKMASLGQLVAGIAHEINNPLSFVLSNVFTARRDLEALAAELGADGIGPLRSLLAEAQTGIERVRDLVLKLRTFSRLDEGRLKTVDIHDSIDSALLILRHRLGDRIEVVRQYEGPRELTCYAGELNQVVMNLVANAIDAIDGPGRITVRTGTEDDRFVITVADTGKGIAAAIRHRIFEPFFTTKPIGQGTGLGLAISYGIVEAHRGSIEVRSEEGVGTEFVVGLPMNLDQGGGA